jgi:hypothetical protein
MCVKHRVETDSWRFGQPIVQQASQSDRPVIRVYAIYARSTLFEVTFQPNQQQHAFVEYRRAYDGHGTQEQTWKIVQDCADSLTH